MSYFRVTAAPASSSLALISSALSLATPSCTGAGADSTTSLASFRPRPVISRTALITAILLSPKPSSTTSNSDFSAAASPPAAGAAATATGAAADTPKGSSKSYTSSEASSRDISFRASMISSRETAMLVSFRWAANPYDCSRYFKILVMQRISRCKESAYAASFWSATALVT